MSVCSVKQIKTLLLGGGLAVVILVLAGLALWWWGGEVEPEPAITSTSAIERESNPNVPDGVPVPKMRTFNSPFGYSLQYPVGWQVDDSKQTAPAEFVKEPSGKAFVAVQVMNDGRLKDPAQRPAIYAENEAALRSAPGYTIDQFEWEVKGAIKDAGGNSYMAMGSYVEKGAKWRFREVMTFSSSGAIFVFRGSVLAEHAKEYGPIVDKIVFSFKPKK